jgi:hypothetical protein
MQQKIQNLLNEKKQFVVQCEEFYSSKVEEEKKLGLMRQKSIDDENEKKEALKQLEVQMTLREEALQRQRDEISDLKDSIEHEKEVLDRDRKKMVTA